MSEQTRNIARAFLYGFTGIGLFRRLKPIGVPMEFVDTRPVDEALASGDYSIPFDFSPSIIKKQERERFQAMQLLAAGFRLRDPRISEMARRSDARAQRLKELEKNGRGPDATPRKADPKPPTR